MIRGKIGGGLEIIFSGRPFADAYDELVERLRAAGDFYRGTQATVSFDEAPSPQDLEQLAAALHDAGIVWDGAYGMNQLSEAARSLIADFAGARSDLRARRRQRGRRHEPSTSPGVVPITPEQVAPEAGPSVLYHRGTLRGGQSLANVGHVVVVGDVNPGAELVAGGDIVVFGALRGVAHAGAQGDRSARVYALVLDPTQLRIATTIAAGAERTGPPVAEEAFLDGDRIAIVAAGDIPKLQSASTAEKA